MKSIAFFCLELIDYSVMLPDLFFLFVIGSGEKMVWSGLNTPENPVCGGVEM